MNMYNKNRNVARDISIYLILMLISIATMRYITKNIASVWIINFVGLCFLTYKYVKKSPRKIWIPTFIYVLLCFITFTINSRYLTSDLKSIGTNINIIVIGINILFVYYFYSYKPLDDDSIYRIFKMLSSLGSISAIFGIVAGLNDISRVISGRLGVYRAQVYGFFTGKNLYGEFVSLSIIAGIYVFLQRKNKKELIFCIIKIIAVVISFSRAALLQMFFMLFIYVFFVNNYSKIKGYFIIICIVSICMYFFSDSFQAFILSYVVRENAGDAGRLSSIRSAFENNNTSAYQMLFGIGYGGIAFNNIDVDNTYVFLYFSGGIIKCILYIMFLVLSAYNISKNIKFPAIKVCLCVFLSYLVYAFFECIAILELGLLNFCFNLFLLFIPLGYKSKQKIFEVM